MCLSEKCWPAKNVWQSRRAWLWGMSIIMRVKCASYKFVNGAFVIRRKWMFLMPSEFQKSSSFQSVVASATWCSSSSVQFFFWFIVEYSSSCVNIFCAFGIFVFDCMAFLVVFSSSPTFRHKRTNERIVFNYRCYANCEYAKECPVFAGLMINRVWEW